MTNQVLNVQPQKTFDAHVNNPNYFGAESLEWTDYHRSRPEYPMALYDILFEYHLRNAGDSPEAWNAAADFGSGPGTILPALLSRFKHVDGSDMNERQIEMGKKTLVPQFGNDRVGMHVGAAGSSDWLTDHSVDLFTAAEAVQWFNVPAWISEAGRKLKPGGTLSFWYYSPNLTIISHPDAAPHCNRLFSIREYVALLRLEPLQLKSLSP